MTRRFEYKYAIDGLELAPVLEAIEFHPAGFKEAYPLRTVNNFYLDTPNLNLFYQNIDGISERKKYRYRWYGDFDLNKKCTLEVKHKENELGWKDHFELKIDDIANHKKLKNHFRSLNINDYDLEAKLYNSYQRYYYESFDKRFRITVDYNQQFGLPFIFGHPFQVQKTDNTLVLELKFDEEHFSYLNDITTHLPYLRTKNSKYSTGITHLLF